MIHRCQNLYQRISKIKLILNLLQSFNWILFNYLHHITNHIFWKFFGPVFLTYPAHLNQFYTDHLLQIIGYNLPDIIQSFVVQQSLQDIVHSIITKLNIPQTIFKTLFFVFIYYWAHLYLPQWFKCFVLLEHLSHVKCTFACNYFSKSFFAPA